MLTALSIFKQWIQSILRQLLHQPLGKICLSWILFAGLFQSSALWITYYRVLLTCSVCLLQQLPATRAVQRFFPNSKTKFLWTSVKCFHHNSCDHFVSVSWPCSIVVGSGIIAQWLWQSNLQFCWDGGLLCRENVVHLWIT